MDSGMSFPSFSIPPFLAFWQGPVRGGSGSVTAFQVPFQLSRFMLPFLLNKQTHKQTNEQTTIIFSYVFFYMFSCYVLFHLCFLFFVKQTWISLFNILSQC